MGTTHEQLQIYWKRWLRIIPTCAKILYNYSFEKCPEMEENYLVLANHNGGLDPWVVLMSFEKQMYFLAGENVSRMGFWSKLIKKYWNPIFKTKSKSDSTAIMKLIRHLKEGHNAAIFPEGIRSFTGITEPIGPSIGKLVKISGAALITFHLEGMYFSTPRWGTTIRRGKTTGKIVNIFSSEELKKMTPQEVHTHIIEDLYENAYETQAKNPVKYRGMRKAQGIENVLYTCPNCKSLGSIKSSWNNFHCKNCKSKAKYTNLAYIKGDFPYTTIVDWDNWQRKDLEEKIAKTIELHHKAPILSHENINLSLVNEDHSETIIDTGKLSLYLDKFVIGNTEIPFTDIAEVTIPFRLAVMIITNKGECYQLLADNFKGGRAYSVAFEIIQNLQKA